jgi:SAM-dependent methyltransferase
MGRWSTDVGADGAQFHSLFEVYDEYLVPLVFQGYAEDLVDGLTGTSDAAILEIAAGTGVVTRLLADRLPASVAITATDLVPGMLARAQQVGTSRPVTWKLANALELPYDDGSFDVVVCAFGAMFLAPHRVAFAEAHRVLRPGGRLVLTVWDRLDANEFSSAVNGAMGVLFPDNPPGFLATTPYAYHDVDTIVDDLVAGGFTASPDVRRIERLSRAATPVDVARALCAGTPLRDEIQERGPRALDGAIAATATCLAERFGPRDLVGRTAAVLVDAIR